MVMVMGWVMMVIASFQRRGTFYEYSLLLYDVVTLQRKLPFEPGSFRFDSSLPFPFHQFFVERRFVFHRWCECNYTIAIAIVLVCHHGNGRHSRCCPIHVQ